LGRLATELGVSRRTVSKYEDGMNASVEVAAQLDELFDRDLTSPVSVLDGAEEIRDAEPTPEDPEIDPADQPIVAMLTRVGFDVHPTVRAPFKAVSEDTEGRETLLTGHSKFTEAAVKRARIMGSLRRVVRTRSVYFVDEAESETIEGTAIVERGEVEDMDDATEFRDLIAARGGSPEA
jgi:putative transcriptional regulator